MAGLPNKRMKAPRSNSMKPWGQNYTARVVKPKTLNNTPTIHPDMSDVKKYLSGYRSTQKKTKFK